MSAARRRRRGHQGAPQAGAPSAPAAPRPLPLPEWKWRTFPVYFAFALGGFVGLYMGLIAGASEGTAWFTFFSIFWAVLLGAGFSRLSTRWILSRRWTRGQARRKG